MVVQFVDAVSIQPASTSYDVVGCEGLRWSQLGDPFAPKMELPLSAGKAPIPIPQGELPVVNQTIPVVVTFHDTNAFTAEHMAEYLGLLVDEAVRLGLPLHHKPFFDNPEELLTAGLARALSTVSVNCSTATLLEAQ